jgi:hypothetical protein
MDLTAKQENGWTSPSVLVMIFLGFFLIVLLITWEIFFSPKCLFHCFCLKDWNVLGTCILTFSLGLAN